MQRFRAVLVLAGAGFLLVFVMSLPALLQGAAAQTSPTPTRTATPAAASPTRTATPATTAPRTATPTAAAATVTRTATPTAAAATRTPTPAAATRTPTPAAPGTLPANGDSLTWPLTLALLSAGGLLAVGYLTLRLARRPAA